MVLDYQTAYDRELIKDLVKYMKMLSDSQQCGVLALAAKIDERQPLTSGERNWGENIMEKLT